VSTTERTPGRPRAAVADLPAYRPGRDAQQAEAEHGITDAIKLASNENPEPPLAAVVEAIAAAATGVNRYADHRATPVREALAARLGVDAACITVGSGSSGVLHQIFSTYVADGDEVLFPWRSFEVYPIYTRLAAGRQVDVALTADLGVDVDALIGALTPATKVVVVATPNNPTGVVCPTADLARLATAAGDDTIVVVDEAYREFAPADGDDAVRDLVGIHHNVVVTRTLSKAQGLAGLRLGYAIGHPGVIADIDKVAVPFAVNALAQAGALAALDNAAAINERVARIVAERTRVVDTLRVAGWWLPEPAGNFVYLPVGDAAADLALALERVGVVVRPFAGDGVRITIGTEAENDRMLTALAAHPAVGR